MRVPGKQRQGRAGSHAGSVQSVTNETMPGDQKRATLSEKRTAANRRNAKKSTGPRTEEGKRRTSRNALRHGLSLRPGHPGSPAETVEQFITDLLLVYGHQQKELRQVARLLAEADAELARVRHVRREFLASIVIKDTMRARGYAAQASETLDQIGRLDRYEQGARRRREKAVRRWLLKLEGCRKGNNDEAARVEIKMCRCGYSDGGRAKVVVRQNEPK